MFCGFVASFVSNHAFFFLLPLGLPPFVFCATSVRLLASFVSSEAESASAAFVCKGLDGGWDDGILLFIVRAFLLLCRCMFRFQHVAMGCIGGPPSVVGTTAVC